jgi:hypothetical protein
VLQRKISEQSEQETIWLKGLAAEMEAESMYSCFPLYIG